MPVNYSYFNEQNFGRRIPIYVLQGVVDAFFPNVCQIRILSQRARDVSFIVSMDVLPYDLGAPQVVTSVFWGAHFLSFLRFSMEHCHRSFCLVSSFASSLF